MRKGASEAQITRYSWVLDMWSEIAEKNRKEADNPFSESFQDGIAWAVKQLTEEFNDIFEIEPKEEEDEDHRDMVFFAEDLRREVEDAAC